MTVPCRRIPHDPDDDGRGAATSTTMMMSQGLLPRLLRRRIVREGTGSGSGGGGAYRARTAASRRPHERVATAAAPASAAAQWLSSSAASAAAATDVAAAPAASASISALSSYCRSSRRRPRPRPRPGLLLGGGANGGPAGLHDFGDNTRRGLVTSRQQKQQQNRAEDHVVQQQEDSTGGIQDDGSAGISRRPETPPQPTSKLWLPTLHDDARTFVELERTQHDHPLLYESSLRRGATSSGGIGVPSFLPKSWNPHVYEKSTPLWEHLYSYIVVTGRPISIATYMRWCLTHPEFGYYNTRINNNATDDDLDDDDNDYEDGASSALNRHVIGRDFVTAPEITSLFGECLAVFFASELERHLKKRVNGGTSTNENVRYRWVECGPGRGTLMRDVLAASGPLHKLHRCESIHFVEASQVLRDAQKQALEELVETLPVRFRFVTNTGRTTAGNHTDIIDGSDNNAGSSSVHSASALSFHEITVVWHDALVDVLQWQQEQQQQDADTTKSPLLTFGICQEFVDALPVYSFQKTAEGWRERMVDLAMEDDDENDESLNDTGASTVASTPSAPTSSKKVLKPRLRVVLAPEVTPPVRTLLRTDDQGWIPGEDPEANLGSIVEVNPEGILLVRDMAALLGSEESGGGGAALVIDYGAEGSRDSIRAFSRHEQLPFLSLPGLVDVTADVDFAALKHAINEPHRRLRQSATEAEGESSTEPDPTQPFPVRAYGPVTQGEFLMSMGLQERVVAVIEDDKTDDDHAENLYQSMVRLAAQDEMGERFKVLAIVSHDPNDQTHEPPTGFLAS